MSHSSLSVYACLLGLVVLGSEGLVFAGNTVSKRTSATPTSAATASAEVDRIIVSELEQAGVQPAARCNDADFLRRATLDITGQLPSPREATLFVLDPQTNKRELLVEKLLKSPEYGKNWARYWRDVIYMPATEQRARLAQKDFETWISNELNENHPWDRIVTSILTATGDMNENPATALIVAQGGQAAEIAAESCRIFLGIQIQCANCHDHPTDVWKRQQFHELAAYFPRIALRQEPGMPKFEVVSVNVDRGRQGQFMRENPERFVAMLDRNGDGKLTKEEMRGRPGMPTAPGAMQFGDRLFELGDTNKDGSLTVAEIKSLPIPNQARQGSAEHHMPDLNDPSSKGKEIDPRFFVNSSHLEHGQTDEKRRSTLAQEITSPENPWFAKAIVNRIWNEFLGEGFYMPVDDLGPSRAARFPKAIDVLADGFVSNHFDVKWLVRAIANTQTYRRKVAAKPPTEGSLPFAAVSPTRLRGDVVFNSLFQVMGIDEDGMNARRPTMGGPMGYRFGFRYQFDLLFGVDPSLPKEDIIGNVPQTLYLMNSVALRPALSSSGDTRLARILRENSEDRDAINEVYLLTLTREPTKQEEQICLSYIKEVGTRGEAYEDLLWSLVNSSEFLSKR